MIPGPELLAAQVESTWSNAQISSHQEHCWPWETRE
jgi:hypothetical protein